MDFYKISWNSMKYYSLSKESIENKFAGPCALGRVKTRCCALFEEFFNPKDAREALAGPSRRCCGTLGEQSGPPFRPLGAPRLDFCWFFDAPWRHQKTLIFRHRPKSIKIKNRSTMGVPRGRFYSIVAPFWYPFGHLFLCFPKRRKFTRTNKNQSICNAFASQIPLFFDLFFIDFSCFVRNPSWRAFLAPKKPTYTPKVDLWIPFGFLGIPKMTFGATIFS